MSIAACRRVPLLAEPLFDRVVGRGDVVEVDVLVPDASGSEDRPGIVPAVVPRLVGEAVLDLGVREASC